MDSLLSGFIGAFVAVIYFHYKYKKMRKECNEEIAEAWREIYRMETILSEHGIIYSEREE